MARLVGPLLFGLVAYVSAHAHHPPKISVENGALVIDAPAVRFQGKINVTEEIEAQRAEVSKIEGCVTAECQEQFDKLAAMEAASRPIVDLSGVDNRMDEIAEGLETKIGLAESKTLASKKELAGNIESLRSSLMDKLSDEITDRLALADTVDDEVSVLQSAINVLKVPTTCKMPNSNGRTQYVAMPEYLAADMLPGTHVSSVQCAARNYINVAKNSALVQGGTWGEKGLFTSKTLSVCRTDGQFSPSIKLPTCEAIPTNNNAIKRCKYVKWENNAYQCTECTASGDILTPDGKCCSNRGTSCCASNQFLAKDGTCVPTPTTCEEYNAIGEPSGLYKVKHSTTSIVLKDGFCNNDRAGGGWLLMALIPTGSNNDNSVGPGNWKWSGSRWNTPTGTPPRTMAELMTGMRGKTKIDYMASAYSTLSVNKFLFALDKWDNDQDTVIEFATQNPKMLFRGSFGTERPGASNRRTYFTNFAIKASGINGPQCFDNQGFQYDNRQCNSARGFYSTSGNCDCRFGASGNNENHCHSNDACVGFGCTFVASGFDTWAQGTGCKPLSTKGYIYIK